MITTERNVGEHTVHGRRVHIIEITWRGKDGRSYDIQDAETGDTLTMQESFDAYPTPEQMADVVAECYGTGRGSAHEPAYRFPAAGACDEANRSATFAPRTSDDTLPYIEVGGVLTFLYLHHQGGAVRVSVDLDDPATYLLRPDGTVPVQVTIQGTVVFDDSEQGRANPAATRDRLIGQLIAAYDGNATRALLDLARAADIGVNYLDRKWFTSYLREFHGIDLTDEQWRGISGHLEDYDDHISAYGRPNVQHEFAIEVCRMAGVLPPAEDGDHSDD
ncbi:hypothetical protein [Planotetraspora sp. GP83]|uniref:hypothetical protein n=1 Tax=Planotetraspora sp. GP83 TaxID=3156264 RepID=UPI003516AB1B